MPRTLFAVASFSLALALACGGGSDTAPPEAPEGTWRDTSCGLIWEQDPGGPLSWQAGERHCEELELGELAWRLPTIGELRCLVNGCPETAPDGACEVNDECSDVGCLTTACDGCGTAEQIGCYWSSQLEGACDDPTWSASAQGDEAYWVLHFRDGSISHDALTEDHYVRCVAAD